MLTSKLQRKGYLVILALTLGATHIWAAGFALYETSSRGVALGGATVGSPRGASTIYDNPAGMTELPGASLEAGISFIRPSMDIDLTTPLGKSTYSPKDKWFPPPFAYYSQQLNDELWAGIGLFTPFGLGVDHKDDWPGRYNSVKSLITSFNVTPTLAYKVSDRLSLSAGLQVMYFDIELTRKLPVPGEPLFKLEGDSVGYGGSAAIAYKLLDDLTVGFVYRSRVKQSLDGDAFAGPRKVGAKGDITLPGSHTFGLNYSGISRWNLGFAATYTDWCSYDELTIKLKDPTLLGVTSVTSEKDWHSAWRLGFGAEYEASERLVLQAGYVYDMDPIRSAKADYLLPPGDRHIISIGGDYLLSNNWKLGCAFAYLILRDVDIAARPQEGVLFPTKFKNGDSLIASVSLAKNF